ncbi:MAG: hypothetical protein HFH89_10155 [Lachnospiraceae bacterium]|nr:hypothetical protein [Lachnospiraceae bacterium]
MQNGKQCTCCGKKLADSAFYKSLNPKHKDKLTPMCKKCCVKQSLDDAGESVDIERFKNTLHFNDKPYRAELHRASIQQAEKKYSDEDGKTKAETIVGLYFGKLSSLHQYKNMTWDDSTLENKAGEILQIIQVGEDESAFNGHKDYPPKAIKAMHSLYDFLQSIYHITDQQQKNLLSAYIDNRIIGEMFIAENLTAEYDDCWQFANHDLVQLKQLRGVEDGIFAECYADFYDVREGTWPWTD